MTLQSFLLLTALVSALSYCLMVECDEEKALIVVAKRETCACQCCTCCQNTANTTTPNACNLIINGCICSNVGAWC